MKCCNSGCEGIASPKSKRGYCSPCSRIAHQKWLELIRRGQADKEQRADEFEALWQKAVAAGLGAGRASRPTPMIVYTPKDVFASFGEDDKPEFAKDAAGNLLVTPGNIDTKSPVYEIEGGVCGFAWVNIKPGNCPFANWMKKIGKIARDSKSYYGGVDVWVHEFGQSMERKESYAHAFAAVLREAGIKAHSMSRMD